MVRVEPLTVNVTNTAETTRTLVSGDDPSPGPAGDDIINGLAGEDTMTGAAGNEYYYVDNEW